MKKQNSGVISGHSQILIRFKISDWTLKGTEDYLSRHYPNLKWKRSPGWDPNGEEHYVFESLDNFTFEVNEFGQKVSQ